MLKHLEKMDARLASIDRSLAAIADAFISLASAGLPETWPEPSSEPEPPADQRADTPFIVTDGGIEDRLWMTRKEAWSRLGIAKSTLEAMINAGELDAYHRKGDERKTKPRVWLKRMDVEAHYRTYTLRKGKEK